MSNSSSSHLSKELLELVKSIGESRSKQEEDKIITAEAQSLKTKFLERNLPEKKMKELEKKQKALERHAIRARYTTLY